MKADYIYLGQSILRYQVPLDIFHSINNIYETNFHNLQPANKQLVGKIKNEHSLFYGGDNENKTHNQLPLHVINYFKDVYISYLEFNKIKNYKIKLSSIWVNEMKQNEYNPVHIHNGNLSTGLSSVMVLKLPETFGKEYSSEEYATNGSLELLGSSSGQFAKINYSPELRLRDFYVFPYDLRHCVYPCNGTTDTRRTLAANCDVHIEPIKKKDLL